MKLILPPNAPITENSEKFHQGMLNRMGFGYAKYGPVASDYPSKFDAIASLKLRLQKYEETGNTEFLMDVANFAMIEYMHPAHKNAHFRATESRESPGLIEVK